MSERRLDHDNKLRCVTCDCSKHTEGDQGLILDLSRELLPSVLLVEIAAGTSTFWRTSMQTVLTHVLPSKEEGSGLLLISIFYPH